MKIKPDSHLALRSAAGRIVVAFLILLGCSAPVSAEISFNFQIRPILSRHCISCHGPDEEERKADLRIDQENAAKDYAIVEGDPDDSELFARITSDDPEMVMPPPEHGAKLSDEEIQLIRQWIDEGAAYEKHWSFVRPQKDPPPKPQTESETSWVYNEIDHFILARMKADSLAPSPQADPYELIRRVSLDLTGLPPTVKLADQFAADPSASHYERIVDQLLADPAYGEHWAAMWLDLARYADTIGYAQDDPRVIWPWRDWVIRAFNENMPYDQFTIEQLAGDLLPAATTEQATTEQQLATAFHRNTLNNTEGGTNDEEFRTIAVKDRISTTVNVWMGLTMRCAECHTHKYDPISQHEYYAFLDFFNQTEDADTNDERPRLEVYPAGREDEFTKLDRQIAEAKKVFAESKKVWQPMKPSSAKSLGGATMTTLDDGSVLATGRNPDFDEYAITVTVGPGKVTGVRLELLTDPAHDGNTGRSGEGSSVISHFRATTIVDDKEILHKFSDAAADRQQPNYEVKLIIANEPAKDGGWAYNHPNDGWRARREAVFTFAKPLDADEPVELTFHILHQSPWKGLNTGRVRLSLTDADQPAKKYREKKLDPLGRKIADLEKQRNAPIRVPILRERPAEQRRDTHVMLRGSFLQPGEQVSAAIPGSFHALPDDAPKNRLGVARWIVSPENSLTARVAVNRFWARLFGLGIVETEEDFGTQGSLPTHPELLDWLAVEFEQSGWDVKATLKLMVMSSTYRQTAVTDKRSLERDPRNLLLSRGPRFRLRAEIVRDQALAISGLLSHRMYGPPVYPPSPIKKIVSAFTGGMTWKVSQGENRYRRAIYTYLKRSQPHPLFDTFDMATREVCSMRRFRTNTPLQSLMTLNDEAFVEASQALARRVRAELSKPKKVSKQQTATADDDSPGEIDAQLARMMRLALLREPTADQLATLRSLFDETLAHYRADAEQAKKMAGTFPDDPQDADFAELAAMTVVANVVLNLDGVLTK